jgi:hypothetical protein
MEMSMKLPAQLELIFENGTSFLCLVDHGLSVNPTSCKDKKEFPIAIKVSVADGEPYAPFRMYDLRTDIYPDAQSDRKITDIDNEQEEKGE